MQPLPSQRRQAAIDELHSRGWLAEVTWHDEIDSTNSLARRRLLDGSLLLPALLLADRQTAGRGRTTRTWWSPSGCLMMSLVISSQAMPDEPREWPQLSLVTGVAVATAVETLVPGLSVNLKCPNDLYVGQSKLAGILVEAVPLAQETSKDMAFIVGLGLNVSVDFADAPSEIQARGCSLSQFAAQPPDVESVLLEFIERLSAELDAWRSGETLWWQQWSQRSLLTGKLVHARLAGNHTQMGHCNGIDYQGSLILQDANGVYHLQSADILHWE